MSDPPVHDGPRPMDPRGPRALAALLACVCFGLVLRYAWICDDAFITLRTADNLLHGLGATWNPVERVQAFTHPLWLGVLTTTHALVPSPSWAVLAPSLAFTGLFLWLFIRSHRVGWMPCLALLVLCGSRSFVDFSTSGLANPVTSVLLLLAYDVGFRRAQTPRDVGLVALLVAGGMLVRLDNALLFGPALVASARRPWTAGVGRGLVRPLVLGFLPLLAWEVFSLLYYGSLVPNTAYAKLATGVGVASKLGQGVRYLGVSAGFDPAGLALVLLGATLAFLPRNRQVRHGGLAILLHLAYVMWIGGDFMAGRMIVGPLVVAAVVVARAQPLGRRALAAACVAFVALALFAPRSPLRPGALIGGRLPRAGLASGIVDERAFYAAHTALFGGEGTELHPWAVRGRALRRALATGERRHAVEVESAIGFFGYFAGPEARIVDPNGLGDPLLARLPIPDPDDWRIGHFRRELPEGYVPSLVSGENLVRDADLAAFYVELRDVTTGELWSARRLRAIVSLHLGRARGHLSAYVERRRASSR